MAKPKILIVDDEKPTRDAMARILSRTYECLTAADAELAMQSIEENPDIALVITDYKMPGANGIDLIRRVKARNPAVGAIIVTAFDDVHLAVEAMKSGANDFLTKPITDIDGLELKVAQAINPSVLAVTAGKVGEFVGDSPAMQRIYMLIRKVAPSGATVLIEGPSGTGKELVARAIHENSSRAKGPFVAVECSALSRDLLESELFGYEPHAFTGASEKGRSGRFEAAGGGTLFLDEIGEIDLATQVKLLRVLETHTIQRVGGTEDIRVDFRLVAATNRDLARAVVEGEFREDLYYRLNVIDLHMPPLKDRPGDVRLLAEHFLNEFSRNYGGMVKGIAPQAMEVLERYEWPGNVRQLRNIVERVVVLASGSEIGLADLPPEIVAGGHAVKVAAPEGGGAVSRDQESVDLAESEKRQILAALEKCGGNKSKAADMLGISRRTIHRKLNEWNR